MSSDSGTAIEEIAADLKKKLSQVPAFKPTSDRTICAKLLLPDNRRKHLEAIRLEGKLDSKRFGVSQSDQVAALELFHELQLHIPKIHFRDAGSKWSLQESKNVRLKGTPFFRFTYVYQCICGCDHTIKSTKTRQMPYTDVSCNAFIKLIATFDGNSKDYPLIAGNLLTIHLISGLFTHSSECKAQVLTFRDARLPLHPRIWLYARSLLLKGVSGPSVWTQANVWSQMEYPPIQVAFDAHHCYIYLPHDTTSLYRSLRLEMGISQKTMAHQNIDTWFRKQDPAPPCPELTDTCLFYQPHVAGVSDRFIVILSTADQRKCAWSYVHKKVILADLTFGFCAARTNLWILMGVDNDYCGIPLAYVIFSAKETTSDRGIHGDYNKEFLTTILKHWVAGMGTNDLGETFAPLVGITDNDIRERSAMTTIWPAISLVLCMYHIWQAWRNALNRSLASVPKGGHRNELRKEMAHLCMRFTPQYPEVLWKARKKPNVSHKEEGAKCHQVSEDYWLQWSRDGILKAAKELGVPENQIPRTSNHLESHNNHLKNDYLAQFQHGGHLPRADVWILGLVTQADCPCYPDCALKLTDNEMKLFNSMALSSDSDVEEDLEDAGLETPASVASAPLPAALPAPEVTAPAPIPRDAPVLVPDTCAAAPSPEVIAPGPSAAPETPNLEAPSCSAEDSWLDDFQDGAALNSSQIIPDLDLPAPRLAPSPPAHPGFANERAILMQELLLATDHCADLLRRLCGLGESPTALTPFISPYNATIIATTSSDASQAHQGSVAAPNHDSCKAFFDSSSSSSSASGESSGAPHQGGRKRQSDSDDQSLVPFERNRKEPRKQSYAQR